MKATVGEILQQLYDSELNASIGWFWDEGVEWKLGDEMGNGIKAQGHAPTVDEAVRVLAAATIVHRPHSDFAKWYREHG